MSVCEECEFASNKSLPETKRYQLLFTYGTLKRGFCNHYHMHSRGVRFVQQAETSDSFILYLDETHRYRPCITDPDNTDNSTSALPVTSPAAATDEFGLKWTEGTKVLGEVYAVNNNLIWSMDVFERVPTHYTRRTIAVRGVDDRQLYDVQAYFVTSVAEATRIQIRAGVCETMSEYTLPVHINSYSPRKGNKRGALLLERLTSRTSSFASSTSPPSSPGSTKASRFTDSSSNVVVK